MRFELLLQLAKENEPYAISKLLDLYRPLMVKESIINGVLDEDLFQELTILLVFCIQKKNLFTK